MGGTLCFPSQSVRDLGKDCAVVLVVFQFLRIDDTYAFEIIKAN